MCKYIERLERCGYSWLEAYALICEYIEVFPLYELENYIRWIEKCG